MLKKFSKLYTIERNDYYGYDADVYVCRLYVCLMYVVCRVRRAVARVKKEQGELEG